MIGTVALRSVFGTFMMMNFVSGNSLSLAVMMTITLHMTQNTHLRWTHIHKLYIF